MWNIVYILGPPECDIVDPIGMYVESDGEGEYIIIRKTRGPAHRCNYHRSFTLTFARKGDMERTHMAHPRFALHPRKKPCTGCRYFDTIRIVRQT